MVWLKVANDNMFMDNIYLTVMIKIVGVANCSMSAEIVTIFHVETLHECVAL